MESVTDVIKQLGERGVKSREEFPRIIVEYFHNKGQKTNASGRVITLDAVECQLNNILRDINSERGKNKNAWWSSYEIYEDESVFKLIKKKSYFDFVFGREK